jgi:AraC-like DNA-binding protein
MLHSSEFYGNFPRKRDGGNSYLKILFINAGVGKYHIYIFHYIANMYSNLFFGVTLLGIFSIIENLKGGMKISLFKANIILILFLITITSFLDFLFELGYDYNIIKSIIRLFGLIAFSNLFYLLAIQKVNKIILYIESFIIIINLIFILNGGQIAYINNGKIINEVNLFIKINFLVFPLFILASIIYSLSIIFKKTDNNNLYSFKIKKWVYLLILMLLLFIILFGTIFLIYSFGVNLPFIDSRTIFILFRVALILFILLRPKFIDDSFFSIDYNSINLVKSNLAISSFDFLFYHNHYYLLKEANISDFALKLNHTKKEVVDFTIKQTGVSFKELVEKKRIEYLLEMLKSNKHKFFTIQALSEMAGFGNRRAMYHAFQKYVGVTPTEYINSLK